MLIQMQQNPLSSNQILIKWTQQNIVLDMIILSQKVVAN